MASGSHLTAMGDPGLDSPDEEFGPGPSPVALSRRLVARSRYMS